MPALCKNGGLEALRNLAKIGIDCGCGNKALETTAWQHVPAMHPIVSSEMSSIRGCSKATPPRDW